MTGIARKVLRQSYLLMAYTGGIVVSLWLAFQLRFDFSVAPEYMVHFDWMLLCSVTIKLSLLLYLGQFGSLLSYFGLHDLGKILAVCTITAVVVQKGSNPNVCG